MANNIDASFAIQENNSLSDAQKIGVLQNNRDREEQRQQRLYEQQKTNQWRNQGIIGDDLNFDKYKTGEQAIDGYAQSELNKIQKEALTNHINDDPAQLEYWLTQQLVPLSQWHNQAQGTYQKLNQTLQDYNKTYPNVDLGKARDLALNKFQNDFLQVDDNGQVLRKNTDEINPTNYNDYLQSPEVLGQINNDVSAFGKFFADIPKNTFSQDNYTNKQGYMKDYKVSGMMPQYGAVVTTDEDNRPKSIELQGEEIPHTTDANGKPLKGITDDMYNKMVSNPQVRSAVLGMWYNSPEYKRAQQSYIANTGKPMPQDAEKVLLKNYLYNQGKQYINHDLNTVEKQATPKITINAGGGANAANTQVNDVYKEIKDKVDATPRGKLPFNELSATAQTEILKMANDMVGGTDKLTQSDIYIGKSQSGGYFIYKYPENTVIAPLDYKSVNLPANNSVKQKQVILHNSGVQPKTAKPKADPLGLF